MEAIKRAVAVVGGQHVLGRQIGTSKQNVSHWMTGRRAVPAEYCPAIERATAGEVRCEDLRPDIEWAVLRAPADPVPPRKPQRQARAA